MEHWLSVREATSHLNKILQNAKSIDEIEEKLVDVIPKFVSVDGVATVRYIKHIGKIFVSHTYGVYEKLLHRYTDDNKGLSGYIIKHKVPLFINREMDIPVGIDMLGTYEEGEHYALFPLLDSTGEVMLIVMSVKINNPFSVKEITTLRSMVIQAGIIYEKIYLRNRMMRFKQASKKIAQFVETYTDKPVHNILTLAKEMLHLCKETITGVEAGSLLMLTSDGFRFIGSLGYKENLLKKPPIRVEHQLVWYGLSKDMWLRGIPRILEKGEILQRDTVEYNEEDGKTIKEAQVTLGIPIVVDGDVKYFLNLDNFSSPAAFDDVDIDIAQLIGSTFTTLADIGRRDIEVSTYRQIIQHISVPQFNKSDKINREKIISTFIKSLIDNIWVLNPDYIAAIHEPMQEEWSILYPDEKNDEPLSILQHIPPENIEGEIYLPEKEIYVTWTSEQLSIGNIKVAIIKKQFLPHGSLWKDALKLIVGYFASFVRIISHARDTKKLTYHMAFRIGKLLEDLSLEPIDHMEFMRKIGPKVGKKLLGEVPYDFVLGLYLHDIGKLLCQTKHQDIEKKTHVVFGSKLLETVKLDHLKYLYKMVKYHHERALGGGPFGLKGSAIPREAEIVGMLCQFHHLLSRELSTEEALRVIHSYSPSHYSLITVDTLKEVMGEENGY